MRLWTCSVCGAVVPTANQRRHTDYHVLMVSVMQGMDTLVRRGGVEIHTSVNIVVDFDPLEEG